MDKLPIVFHRIKTVLFYSIASIVIIIALAVSGVRLILTTANLYQEEVEQLASNLLEQSVKIGRMDAKLSGLVPTLIFHDVQVISEKKQKALFSLARVDVGISYEKLIWQQEIVPEQITIRGIDIHITRTIDGKYKLKGFDLEGLNKEDENEFNSILEAWLSQEGEIGVEDSSLTWVDQKNSDLTWNFSDVNFLLKKDKDRYQLSLASKLPEVLGRKIELSLDFTGDVTIPDSWDVKAYIESKGFNLSPLKEYINNEKFKLIYGVTDFKLWLDWKNKRLKQLSGNLKLSNISYQLNKDKKVKLNLVSGVFDAKRDNSGTWNVSVDKFNYKHDKKYLNESKFLISFNNESDNTSTFIIKADYLKLEALSKIVIDNHLLKLKQEETLKQLKLHGEINDFYISWKKNKLQKVNAKFENFGVDFWNEIPKLAGISGQLIYEDKEGVLSLLSRNSVVGFPNLFREDFKLDLLSAEIAFTKTNSGVLLDTKELKIKNSEVEAIASAKLWLPLDDSSSYIDLQTYISKGDVSKISHFLPVTIMDKDLVTWLDASLVKGKVNSSTIILNGKLDDFPFDNKEGIFTVDMDVSDLTLKYLDDWPEISNANITAVFTGQGLKLDLSSGESSTNILYDSSAEIESYLNADLNINILAHGSSQSGVQFLVDSPIFNESADTIRTMRFTGDVTTKVKINVPLGDEVVKEKSFSYSGESKFNNTSVFMVKDKIDITEGDGTIFFTEKGLSSKKLSAKIFNEPAKLSVNSSLNYKSVKIAVTGKIEPNIIFKRFELPGAKNISGKTNFKAEMIFPDESLKNNNPILKVSSNLLGVKSRFPEFMNKKRNSRSNVNFQTIFTGGDSIQFVTDFDKYGSAIIEIDQSDKKSYLKKGAISFSAKKAILPRKNILYVDGSINKITPSKWLEALNFKPTKGRKPFFVNPIVVNLDKINILTNKDKKVSKIRQTNPAKLPVFEGIVKKLYLDGLFLGRLDIKTSQKRYGLSFDEIILSAQHMKLFSHGKWIYKNRSHQTEMDFTLSSKDFGAMLGDLDFSAIVRKGVAQASGKLKWNTTPSQFALQRLNGDVHLKIEKGNIREVDAGVGRLLGLFSLTALPRKLIGDFNDTFKSGFSFDVAEGTISIEDGDAYMDDFEVNSPVADVSISGRTGLADRDYENTIEVVPDVGGGLAGITALLVNLPAGIGLWLVDKITGEQFNEASSKLYEITGSWESPEIEEVEDR